VIVREGLRTIFGQPVLRAVTTMGIAWSIPAAVAWALTIPLLRQELALGSRGAGIVIAAGAATGILAPALVGLLGPRVGGIRILVYGIPVAGVATAAFGLASGFVSALAAYCLMELAGTVTTAAYIGERQRRAPLGLQSTVGIFGRMIIMVSLALGSAIGSALADVVSLRELYLGSALAILGVSGVMGVVLTRVTRSERAADRARAVEAGQTA
jgi:MFS family permease